LIIFRYKPLEIILEKYTGICTNSSNPPNISVELGDKPVDTGVNAAFGHCSSWCGRGELVTLPGRFLHCHRNPTKLRRKIWWVTTKLAGTGIFI